MEHLYQGHWFAFFREFLEFGKHFSKVVFSLMKLTYLLTLATRKLLNVFLLVFFNGPKMVRHKSPGEYEAVEKNSPIGLLKRY